MKRFLVLIFIVITKFLYAQDGAISQAYRVEGLPIDVNANEIPLLVVFLSGGDVDYLFAVLKDDKLEIFSEGNFYDDTENIALSIGSNFFYYTFHYSTDSIEIYCEYIHGQIESSYVAYYSGFAMGFFDTTLSIFEEFDWDSYTISKNYDYQDLPELTVR